MPTFVANETEDEEILFAAFGELPKGKDPKKAVLIKEGKSLTGIVKEISDSKVYGKIYRMKVEGEDKIVVITGKTDLNNKMGYGTTKARRQVKVDDLIQVTFKGIVQTGKGRPFYSFDVGIAE